MLSEDARKASHPGTVTGRRYGKTGHLRLVYSRDWEPAPVKVDETADWRPSLIPAAIAGVAVALVLLLAML